MKSPCQSLRGTPGRLWERAPAHDQSGKATGDLLLWVPASVRTDRVFQAHLQASLRAVCEQFAAQLLLLEMNGQTGTLWFSFYAQPGLAGEIAQSVRVKVPEVRVIGMPGCLDEQGPANLPVRRQFNVRMRQLMMAFSRTHRRVWHRLLPVRPDNAPH